MNLFYRTNYSNEAFRGGPIANMQPINSRWVRMSDDGSSDLTGLTGSKNFHSQYSPITTDVLKTKLAENDVKFFLDLSKFFLSTQQWSLYSANYQTLVFNFGSAKMTSKKYNRAVIKLIDSIYNEIRPLLSSHLAY